MISLIFINNRYFQKNNTKTTLKLFQQTKKPPILGLFLFVMAVNLMYIRIYIAILSCSFAMMVANFIPWPGI
ncbi:MAG: hypothetical protein EAZ53_05075 [Bacteroidetes bacterium]|nr:MAG: hypothetical protein EAZ53_05075 [Bacteroidota bacterium]